jgi:putative ABC transport system permease protein
MAERGARAGLARLFPVRAGVRSLVSGGPLWRKAPLLPFRFPLVLLGVVAGAFVLAVAAATPPLFLSSAGGVELSDRLARVSPVEAGLTIQAFGSLARGESGSGLVEQRDRAVAAAAARLRGVGPPELTLLGSQVNVAAAGGSPPVRVQTLFREGFERHVTLVRGSAGADGVWLDDATAARLGAEPGHDVILANTEGRTVPVPVAATYRSLSAGTGPVPAFWAGLSEFIRAADPRAAPPPPLLLADQALLRAAGERLGMTVRLTWELPLLDRVPTLEEARGDAARFDAVTSQLTVPTDAGDAPFGRGAVVSELPAIVDAADRSVDGIAGPVDVVSGAGRALALGMLAAAAAAEARRRRREIRMMNALGGGPAQLGVTAVLEVVAPFVLAGAAGILVATWLVDRAGPGGAVAASARASAAWQAGWWLAGALLVVAGASVLEARRTVDEGGGRVRQALVGAPWELVVLLLAGASLYEVVTQGGVRGAGGVTRVDAFALLFPLLFVVGAAGLLARGAGRALPTLSAVRPGRSTARYLAARRLASAPSAVLALGATAAAAASLLLFAGIVSTSARASTEEKVRDAAGADLRVEVAEGARIPADLGFPHTEVWRVVRASVLPSGPRVTVLAVDPRTFASAALWSGAFSGRDPDEVLAPLAGRGTRLPVVAVGGGLSGSPTLELASRPVPASVRGTTAGFPGRTTTRPVVVASRVALEAALGRADSSLHGAGAQRELWVRGDPPAVLAALRGAGVAFFGPVRRADRAAAVPAARAVGWVFDLLRVLGAMAVLVALAGLVLYLRAGRRARDVGYALAVRMGLARGTHWRAVVLELGGILAAALLVGALLAAGAAWVVFRQFELLPTVPPPAGLHVPWALVGAMAVGGAVATLLGAWVIQRGVDRVRVAEVLRLAP